MVTIMNEEIIIRLKGAGIAPGLIRSKELAEILESVEDMVVAETIKANPDINKEDIIVGLYAIEDKSIGLNFKTTIASVVIPVFINIANAIEENRFNELTPKTLSSITSIINFTKRHACEAILGTHNTSKLTTITKNTQIPQHTYIEGPSEIIGKVIRVGGKKPKATLELTDGTTIYCQVTEDLAKELGNKLYTLARFTGNCKWNFTTSDLEEFTIFSVEEFDYRNTGSVLEKLSQYLGKQFLEIDDVDNFVTNLRY